MELRSPIRLYWDLTPSPVELPDYNRICSEIATSRALTLHLTDLGNPLHPTLAGIIADLAVAPLELSLTVSACAAGAALQLCAAGVKKLYADVTTADEVAALAAGGISCMSFRTTPGTFMRLPDIIAACAAARVTELQLPMERLISGAQPLCLSSGERDALACRIREIPFAGRLTVTANDPFLWRVVRPDTPFPDGICQAANTMLAISPNGDVFPCPAFPIWLGNLTRISYREIVSSPAKRELRRAILTRPAACAGCQLLDDCRGGCRGRGCDTAGTLDAADPACAINSFTIG